MTSRRVFNLESYANGAVYNHSFDRDFQSSAIDILREIFPKVDTTYSGDEKRANDIMSFLSNVGVDSFQEFVDNKYARRSNGSGHESLLWVSFQRNLAKTSDKAGLFKALLLANTPAKLSLASIFCDKILAVDHITHKPSEPLTRCCLQLINLFCALPESAYFGDLNFRARLEKILVGRSLAFFQTFYNFLANNDDVVHNIQIIHRATEAQIQFFIDKRMEIDFLAMLVQKGIDRSAPAAKADGQLVALSAEEVERADLQPGDKLGAIEAAFALFNNDAKAAMAFFRNQQAQLFALNTKMLGLFTQYAKDIENQDDRALFLRVLSKSKTKEDNNFVAAIFAALDISHAMRAMKKLEVKSQKGLSSPQKIAITTAFQSNETSGDEKIDLFEAIFEVNFRPEILAAIAQLHAIMMDRHEFVANLKSLKASDNLFKADHVEMLTLLHKKNVSIDFEYAKHLAKFPYLIQFKEFISQLSDRGVQAIFNKDSKQAAAREWIRALQTQAQASHNQLLQLEYIKLIFNLWSYAESNSKEIGLNRQDLLGADFNDYFCSFLLSIDFNSAGLKMRNLFLASIRSAVGLIMPSSVAALAGAPQPQGMSGRFLSFLGGSRNSAPLALEAAPATAQVPGSNLAKLFAHLGVLGLDGTGAQADWRFATIEARNSYADDKREADMELAMLPPGQTYLDLINAAPVLGGPQVEEAEEAVAESHPNHLALTW